MTLVFGKLMQKIFYGPLRPAEVEHLYEKAWYAITETCLAMTIFRDEFHSRFVVMFTLLLFLKCFHWLGSDRVDFMEQTPPTRPYIFHARVSTSLLILVTVDYLLMNYCVVTLMQLDKPNMLVMFAFEFAILTIGCSGVIGKYIIGVCEKLIVARKAKLLHERRRRVLQRRVDRDEITQEEMDDTLQEEQEAGDAGAVWEAKSSWMFYLDIATDLLKLFTYLLFFAVVLTFYGLPLHIVRDVYITIRSFIGRVRDFIAYRRATAHMNSRYPDATREEIGREAVCIICREEMTAWSDTPGGQQGRPAQQDDEELEIIDERFRPKKLPCGHVLHLACLKSWMERQQRCPTCRRPVLDTAAGQQQFGGPQQQPQPQPPQEPAPVPDAAPVGAPGVLAPGFVAPPPGFGPAPGQGQGQGQPAGQPAPQNNQQQPQGFGLNFFAPPEGGFVRAFARNIAQRQERQLQQAINQEQQQREPDAARAANIEALRVQINDNLNTVIQTALQDYVRIQELFNNRVFEHIQLLRADINDHLRTLNLGTLPPRADSLAGANGESANQPSRTTPAGTAPATPDRNVVHSSHSVSFTPAARSPLGGSLATATPGPSHTAADQANDNIGHQTNGNLPVQVDNIHIGNYQIPPEIHLPPGWSLVPLYAQGSNGSQSGSQNGNQPGSSNIPTLQHQSPFPTPSTPQPRQHSAPPSSSSLFHPSNTPSQQPPSTTSSSPNPPADISLSNSGIRRRGIQRQYSNSLHAYHNLMSPRGEQENPFSSSLDPPSTTGSAFNDIPAYTESSSNLFTADNTSQPINIPSPSRQMTGQNNSHPSPLASSPSRHGSISSTSREVLERRHREAHSPNAGNNLSPAGTTRAIHQPGSNPELGSDSISMANRRTSRYAGDSTASGPGHHSDAPTLDTSIERNHPVDLTHDPTQGRSPVEERRRASAGEILLSETDTAWPAAQAGAPGTPSASGSEAGLSPASSLPGSRVGSIRRGRRSSTTGPAGGSGSPVGTYTMFNVIPKSQASSTVGSPIISHSSGLGGTTKYDLGSPSRISLDKGKGKEEDNATGSGAEDNERGRKR
ncbi:hypothetical protein ABW19_dt0209966 [Dactylella cylindrospora]|nr:hypothetical protein ABW19_dt0209966 [Dactylella cylindrospora]